MVRAVVRVSVVIIDCRQSQSSLNPGRDICYRTSRIRFIPSIHPSQPYSQPTITIMAFSLAPPPGATSSIFYIFHPAILISTIAQSHTLKTDEARSSSSSSSSSSTTAQYPHSLFLKFLPSFVPYFHIISHYPNQSSETWSLQPGITESKKREPGLEPGPGPGSGSGAVPRTGAGAGRESKAKPGKSPGQEHGTLARIQSWSTREINSHPRSSNAEIQHFTY